MNSFDYNYLKEQFMKFEEKNVCNICSVKVVNPVRIKVCGHYFCEECLQNTAKNEQCPKCKEHYENNEIDYRNAARKLQLCLDDFKAFLNSGSTVVVENKIPNLKENSFVYLGKQYHLNYLDDILTKVNKMGESALHIACKKKKLIDVLNLLTKDTDVNVQDFAGWAPLHESVESESLDIVEALLKHGALIDIMGEEYATPLHKAVIIRNKPIIELLLKYGASRDIRDYFGKKPQDYDESGDCDISNIFDTHVVCSERVQELFLSKKMTVYCYYIEEEYIKKLKSLKNVKIEDDFVPKKISHFFIRKTHKPSIKILSAMLSGCTIVPQEWIDNILNDEYFFNIPEYTYISNCDLNNGIQKAMMNSCLKLPKLFDGIRFYIHGHKTKISIGQLKITKEDLFKLITEGGGKTLPRAPTPTTCIDFRNFPYHSNKENQVCRCCHYIIFEENDPPLPLYQMPDLKHKSSKWLIDCIINFSIHD